MISDYACRDFVVLNFSELDFAFQLSALIYVCWIPSGALPPRQCNDSQFNPVATYSVSRYRVRAVAYDFPSGVIATGIGLFIPTGSATLTSFHNSRCPVVSSILKMTDFGCICPTKIAEPSALQVRGISRSSLPGEGEHFPPAT